MMRPWALALLAACGFPALPSTGDGGTGSNDGGGNALPIALQLVAGDYGGEGNLDGAKQDARFDTPAAIAVGGDGTIYIADTNNHEVRMMTPSGFVTTLAGRRGSADVLDGSASMARFASVRGIAVASDGSLIVADAVGQVIREVAPDGTVSTIAGVPYTSGSNNGPALLAHFHNPTGVALGDKGTIYVADAGNNVIRAIASGMVTTFAGQMDVGGDDDGTTQMPLTAKFSSPQGVAVGSDGSVYVADTNNGAIRAVTSLYGVQHVLVGLKAPSGIACDSQSNLYVADGLANKVIELQPNDDNNNFTVAGTGSAGWLDGSAGAAELYAPEGVGVSADGTTIYVADTGNQSIRTVANGSVSTLAGKPPLTGSADGTGSAARFLVTAGIDVDTSGHAFVCDVLNDTIREVSLADGVTMTIAGTGSAGSNDGVAARFSMPYGVATGADGALYVADTNNDTIRRVALPTGATTWAGVAGVPGANDGTGSAAHFTMPYGIAAGGDGSIYVADTQSYTVRQITASGDFGAVATIAGAAEQGGSDGAALAAQFDGAQAIAVAPDGTIYIADTQASTIRKLSGGQLTTFAGQFEVRGSQDGTGSGALFDAPSALRVDAKGNVFVADTDNATIRKITPAGVVTTVAGTPGHFGVLLGTTPSFSAPLGLAFTGSDDLLIDDASAVLLLQHGAQ
jgi:sugar lactone lactonase YvrE